MKIMRYRMELDHNEGYVISNADTPWESMPTESNFKRSPVRLYYLDDGKKVSPELSGCIDEPDDEEITSRYFRKNYVKVLQGRSKTWYLIGIRITRFGASLLFGNRKTHDIEFLHIYPILQCTRKFRIEVDCEDGTVEKYELSVRKSDHKESCCVRLTEFYASGRRELIFNFGLDYYDNRRCPDEDWDYVYVTEYCQIDSGAV